MSERNAAAGYAALSKQTDAFTEATPTLYVPYYKQSLVTNNNLISDEPVYGNKFKRFQTLAGIRSHNGSLTVMAEPNTAAYWFDMLSTKSSSTTTYTFTVTSANATIGATFTNNGATFTVTATIVSQTTLIATATSGTPSASGTLTKASGTGDATIAFSAFTSGPTTHAFAASGTTDPNFYTLDLSFVSQVVRFSGIAASKIAPTWDGQKMQFEIDVSGLASFYGREIASISTTVLTLADPNGVYNGNPTNGLVASDLVKITKIDGSSSLTTTVVSITATTVTLGASAAAFAAGDMIVLRPATPSLSLLTPFLWGKTQFFFAADAATALTNSATATNQTRLEPGTTLELMHDFNNKDGEPRSGNFDPASLIRDQYDLTVKIQKYFDTPDEIKYWNGLTKRAMLMRSYSGSTNQYELRWTVNNMTGNDSVSSESGKPIYADIEYSVNYDQTDGQGFGVTLIDAVPTV